MVSDNPFSDPALIAGYEAWYGTAGLRADRLEKALLKRLLAAFPEAHSILEVGCGTGHFTRWFTQQGLHVVGLDCAPAMLTEAVQRGHAVYVEGDALALPFATGAFDLVSFVTTLEFVSRPTQALSEAVRVARQGVLLGVLNRTSLLARKRKRSDTVVWQAAHFFSPPELMRLVRQAAGTRLAEVTWRTTLWPVWPGSLPLPWGDFIGLRAKFVRHAS